MRFNKLQATQLFDGYSFRENSVLILQEEGTVENIVALADAGDDIQQVDGILSPGFINCHCHLELSHLKNQIGERTGLAGFVRQVVTKRNVSEATILRAIQEAEAEMIDNGIVAVGDICNSAHTFLQKKERNIYYHNFIEAMGADPAVAEKNFAMYKMVYDQFSKQLNEAQVSIAPHAPYSVSEPLWKKILLHNTTGLFTIHNQETLDETLWFTQKTGGFVEMFDAMGLNTNFFQPSGRSSLQTFLPEFSAQDQLLLVHNVFTKEEDILFAEAFSPSIYWCFCPNANQYISQLLPNLPIFTKNKAKIVLGTDSLASNHQLSIWEEIKTMQAAFPQISLEEMLGWATINGAKALKINGRFGSFEKGKKPGLVNIVNDTAERYTLRSLF